MPCNENTTACYPAGSSTTLVDHRPRGDMFYEQGLRDQPRSGHRRLSLNSRWAELSALRVALRG